MIKTKKISNAAVIIPPLTDFYTTPHRLSALGAGILARLLEDNNTTVYLFNFPLEHSQSKTVPIPDTLNYLTPHILPNETGRGSFFTHYYLFGPSLQECVNKVVSISPDIIFLSCFAFCYADSALAFARELKQSLPDVSIIAGGGGASVHPAYFVSSGCIDFVITGEAELSVIPLVQYLRDNSTVLLSDIPNLVTKEKIIPSDSQQLYTNDTSMEPGYRSSMYKKELRIDLTISRGCPLQCAFCSNRLCHGTEFRRASLHKIDSLIRGISGTLPCEPATVKVNFEDDNLLIDSSFWFDVLKIFKERFPAATFYAENGLDYRLLTEESAHYLIRMGMAQFNIALGTINKDASALLSRDSSPDHYERLLSLFKYHSIPVISYFIAGFQGDNRKSIAENLLFFWKRTTLIGISMFYPVPGLPGFTDYKMFKTGKSIRCCGSSAFPWNKSVDTATLVTAFRLSRLINLIKSGPLNQLEEELISQSLNKKVLHTIIRLKKEKAIIEVPNQDVELAGLVLGKLHL
ncbi:MAG: cobalamin-dependent protein [Chitinispirillaceae bacterium]|nr:cobalamin-dependent protein [Chitinispirillaceae bacterium]